MANHAPPRRRHRRLFRSLLVLVATPALIATNLLGTMPDNPFSSALRQELSLAFPAEFVDGLNLRLDEYDLPTLPPPPEERPAGLAAGILTNQSPAENATPEAATEAAATQVASSPAGTPAVSLSPTPQATLTFVSTLNPTATPIPDIAGTWRYEYNYEGHEEYMFEDVIVIANQGGGYVVTSVTNNFGPVTLLDQVWNGSYLEFFYEVPASTVPWGDTHLMYVKTLRMENGNLIILEEQGEEWTWTRLP
jgi:hypothetical protein